MINTSDDDIYGVRIYSYMTRLDNEESMPKEKSVGLVQPVSERAHAVGGRCSQVIG